MVSRSALGAEGGTSAAFGLGFGARSDQCIYRDEEFQARGIFFLVSSGYHS